MTISTLSISQALAAQGMRPTKTATMGSPALFGAG
jgi:hypothetical protein